MGEPALRLVLPDDAGDGEVPPRPAPPAPAAGWPATTASRPASSPLPGATNPAASTGARGAASPPAPNPAAAGAAAAATAEPGPPAAAAAPEDGDGSPAGLELPGRPMTAGELAGRAVRHWAGTARANATYPGGVLHAIWHGTPGSLAEHSAYVASRAWVPDGHEGALIPAAGAVYGRTAGMAGVAAGLAVAWAFARPLRLILSLLVLGTAAGLAIWFS